jgi:hypothetical protein
MIYSNILGKPIFELDNYLDLTNIEFLEKKTAIQIAKHKDKLSVGFSGPSDPRWLTWFDESTYLEVKNSWVNVVNDIPNDLSDEWKNLTHDQQLYFTLLTTKSKSLNYSLTLRTINQNLGGNAGKFHLKHLTSETSDTAIKKDFNFLFDWINNQNVFSEIGRCQIFINPEGNYTPIHRDYGDKSRKDQFLWIRLNKRKNFFIYDSENNEKHYVQGYVSTFDNHQWHGSEPSEFVGFSIRIDGVFSKSFLNKSGLDSHFG